MDEQIKAAAKWWADQLRDGAKQDAGDSDLNDSFRAASRLVAPPSPEAIDDFEQRLIKILHRDLPQHWYEDDPLKGGYFRVLHCDYQPIGMLDEATQGTGLRPLLHFPIKTVMWINPDSVKVACGYGAEEVTIWEPVQA